MNINRNTIPKAIIIVALSIPIFLFSLIVHDLAINKIAFADSQALKHNQAGSHQSEKGFFSMSEKADITLNGLVCQSSSTCQPPPGDGGGEPQ